jgi:hypothetical protein
MSRKNWKRLPGTPSLPDPTPRRRRPVPPLPLGHRVAIHSMTVLVWGMVLMLAYAAVQSLRTGVTMGRGSVTAADDPFGFYLTVVVFIVMAVYLGSLAVSVGRTK